MLKLIKATLQVDKGVVWRMEANWEYPAKDDHISGFSSFENSHDDIRQPNPQFVYLWIDLMENIKANPDDFVVTFFDDEYYIYRKSNVVNIATADLFETLNNAMTVPVALVEFN